MINKKNLIAQRMKNIDSSGIRKVFNLTTSMKDPVNLSIGQPDFPVPEVIKKEAINSILSNRNAYTLTQGIPELRKWVEDLYLFRYQYKAEASIITSGVSGGLMLAIMALINPGDEVLIPDPFFVMYKHLVNLFNGVPVFYDTYPDFRIHKDRIESKITSRTKVILINTPSNPTGAVLHPDDLNVIANIAATHGLIVISDEIYENFTYDSEYNSICEYMKDNLIILNGFSKSASITGWRLGYALGPRRVLDEMIKVQQYSFVCAPSFAQYAILKYGEVDKGKILKDYREKRDIIYSGLKDRFEMNRPEGAFYMFPKVPKKYKNASEFCEKAIANNMLIIPGNVFSETDTHFRISFAADNKVLERGVKILNSLA